MGRFDHLPTLNGGLDQQRRATPKAGLVSRLEAKTADERNDKKLEKVFRRDVIKRDGKVCRHCKRGVLVTMEHVPERLEVHHIHGRLGVLRFEPSAALVVCCACHEQLTGAVGKPKLFIVGTAKQMFTAADRRRYLDARKPLQFQEAAQ